MKKISYSIIAIFLFGLIAMGFTNKANIKTSFLIQTAETNVSSASLSQSAVIISNRLKDFSADKYEVTVIPEKSQIQVTLANDQDLSTVEKLLTQKGAMVFYETYNRKSFSELLNSDHHLFSLFNVSNADDSGAKIGCTSVSGVKKVNDYLITSGLSQKYKFAWSQNADSSDVCLYALKTNSDKTALITGTDIESVKFKQDKASKSSEIDIILKKSVVGLWADATKRNMNNTIAIVLDDHVISAPVVRSEITGGHCTITGNYSQTEAKYIAALGNNGALPVSFKIVK